MLTWKLWVGNSPRHWKVWCLFIPHFKNRESGESGNFLTSVFWSCSDFRTFSYNLKEKYWMAYFHFFSEWMLIWLRILYWSYWSEWSHYSRPQREGKEGLWLHSICKGSRELRGGHENYFPGHELPGSDPNAPAKYTQKPDARFRASEVPKNGTF